MSNLFQNITHLLGQKKNIHIIQKILNDHKRHIKIEKCIFHLVKNIAQTKNNLGTFEGVCMLLTRNNPGNIQLSVLHILFKTEKYISLYIPLLYIISISISYFLTMKNL